jgi:hypothetical protein
MVEERQVRHPREGNSYIIPGKHLDIFVPVIAELAEDG